MWQLGFKTELEPQNCNSEKDDKLAIDLISEHNLNTIDQWFPTGVPWGCARGAANLYNSLIFIPIWPSKGAAKYKKT